MGCDKNYYGSQNFAHHRKAVRLLNYNQILRRTNLSYTVKKEVEEIYLRKVQAKNKKI